MTSPIFLHFNFYFLNCRRGIIYIVVCLIFEYCRLSYCILMMLLQSSEEKKENLEHLEQKRVHILELTYAGDVIAKKYGPCS